MAWLVRLFAALFLLLAYLVISAEGMRGLFETAATPLYKTGLWPLTHLGRFTETRKLDVAHILCLGLLAVVWVSWEMITGYYGAGHPMTNPRRLVWCAGTVVLVCDAVLFFTGVTQSGFIGGASVFAALVFTALYLGMLVFLATVVNMIEGRIEK